MKTIAALLLTLIFYGFELKAQEITSYEQFLEYNNSNNQKLGKLQDKEQKTESDRYKIIQIYNETNRLYESLVQQNVWYRSEIIDIMIDNYTYCMRKYPNKGDTLKINQYFNQAKQLGLCDYKYVNLLAELRNTEVFHLIKLDPCVKRNLNRLESEERLWKDYYFSKPYRYNISEQDKIAGLSKLWAEVKFNFAFFDQIPDVNWDSLYYTFIPKVLSSKSTTAYYDTLLLLCAKLKDSHTQVFYPDEANIGRPPVRSKIVENKVLISDIYNDELIEKGLESGMEILKINGLATEEYARRYVSPYICSSTKQDSLIRTYELFLFSGNRDEVLLLELIDINGIQHEFRVERNLPYNNFSPKKAIEYKTLEDNIGYLTINSFSSNNKVVSEFDSIYNYLNTTDALIMDIRNNGGGSSVKASYIFSCFIDTISAKWMSETREYLPSRRAWYNISSWHRYSNTSVKPNMTINYSKPIVILTTSKTISAAEDFCLLFDFHERATIIGEPTAGSTGQPLYFTLPGGGRARVCTLRSYYPTGNEFVGYGIMPDIYVEQSLVDFLNGRDSTLEMAKDYLAEITSIKN